MSAKEFYAKPKPRVPDVPVEIWQIIFREATGVYGPLEVPLVTRGYTSTAARRADKLFKASLVTKRYLPRVCKAWHAIASPFLYEQICTGRGRCLVPLCYALKQSHRAWSKASYAEDVHGSPLGWATRRLDVSFRDFDSQIHDLEVLADIIEELPNLTAIVFCTSAPALRDVPLPSRALRALRQCQNLKTVQWFDSSLYPYISDWAQFLKISPSLSTVIPNYARESPDHIHEQPPPCIDLPSVTTYFVDPISYGVSFIQMKLSMNNLQHLIFHISQLVDFPDWTDSLPTFRSITHLELYWVDPDGLLLDNVVETFANSCPHLIRLYIVTWRWSKLTVHRLPRSIQELGLRCMALQLPEGQLIRLFWTLQGLVLAGSSGLKFIQLLDAANVGELYKHKSVVEHGIQPIQFSKVKLLDEEGREIRWENSRILWIALFTQRVYVSVFANNKSHLHHTIYTAATPLHILVAPSTTFIISVHTMSDTRTCSCSGEQIAKQTWPRNPLHCQFKY